jgi:hypothetical protein
MTIWNILLPFVIMYIWPFGIVRGHLVCFPVLVSLYQEKSGNPVVAVIFVYFLLKLLFLLLPKVIVDNDANKTKSDLFLIDSDYFLSLIGFCVALKLLKDTHEPKSNFLSTYYMLQGSMLFSLFSAKKLA